MSFPKPKSFAEEIGGQLTDLRQAVERLSAHFRATLEHKENIVRGSDRDQLARYTEDNSQLNGVGAVENRVVFFGDLITDGWPLNQYFPGRPYVNRGIGGQITSQMLGPHASRCDCPSAGRCRHSRRDERLGSRRSFRHDQEQPGDDRFAVRRARHYAGLRLPVAGQ